MLTSSGSPTAVTTDPKWGTHCAEFNTTSNENIDVASPSDFRAAGQAATLDFWFNPTTAGTNTNQGSTLRNALLTLSTAVPVQLHPSGNTVGFFWWNTADGGTFGFTNTAQTATGVTAGSWHHVRAIWYADNTFNIYLDGTRFFQTVATTFAFDCVSLGTQVTAALVLDGFAASFAFQGFVDSLRMITGTALDPSSATTITVPAEDFPNI